MNEFFRKMRDYLDQPRAWNFWTDSGMLYGAEDWPLLAAIEREQARRRNIIYAPVRGLGQGGIAIRAQVDTQFPEICQFMIDRPVLRGYSAYFASREDAAESPFAQDIFAVGGIVEITIDESIVTVTREPSIDEEWRDVAREIGQIIRAQLQSGQPAIAGDVAQRIPPEDELIRRVDRVFDEQINPVLTEHYDYARLAHIDGNTLWINLGGDCPACATLPLAMRHGIGQTIRRAVPEIGAIHDAMEDCAGINVYFPGVAAHEERFHEAA